MTLLFPLLIVLLVIALVTLVTAVAPELTLPWIARALIREAPAKPADAVVITPEMGRGGILEAVILWRQGTARQILVTNVALDRPPGTDADAFATLALRELTAHEVPLSAVVVVSERPCTHEAYLHSLTTAATEYGLRSLIFLAPQLDSRRLQSRSYAAFESQGIVAQVVTYRFGRVDVHRWWTTRTGVNSVFNAYLAYMLDLLPMAPYPACRAAG